MEFIQSKFQISWADFILTLLIMIVKYAQNNIRREKLAHPMKKKNESPPLTNKEDL
jgi:hypothetical protein